MSTYSYDALVSLWLHAGGNNTHADMAAAIALAESGGKTTEVSSTHDYGLWQINIDAQPEYRDDPSTLFDPMTNARAAIAISAQGSNWRPWCTAYADGACGTRGGAYLGAGAPYQRYLHYTQGASSGGSNPEYDAAAGPGSELLYGELSTLPGTGAPYEPWPNIGRDAVPSMVRAPGKFGYGNVGVGVGLPSSLGALGVPGAPPAEPQSAGGPAFAHALPAIESQAVARGLTDDPDLAANIRALDALGR